MHRGGGAEKINGRRGTMTTIVRSRKSRPLRAYGGPVTQGAVL